MNSRRLIKFVGFNLLWLAIAMAALTPYLYFLTSLIVTLFLIDFKKLSMDKRKISVSFLVIGLIFDFVAQTLSWISFFPKSSSFLPLWLVSIWLLFIWILPDLVAQFSDRLVPLVFLSVFAGPLSYYSGKKFDLVEVADPESYFYYGLFWGSLMFAGYFLMSKEQEAGLELKNKNILITGSSRGIGLALANELAKRRVCLHLVQRTWDSSKVEELLKRGAIEVKQWTCDLSQLNEVKSLCSKLKNEKIDILINNAGILTGELLENQTDDEIQNVFQMNLTVSAMLTKAVLPNMIRQKTGRIVNNTSVSAYMRFPCATTYAAAKSGLLAMTECLDTELNGTGVSTLALVTPGIKTDMFDEIKNSYGKYFEAPSDSISADEYARNVVESILNGRKYLLPKGRTRFGLWLAKFAPGIFKKMVIGKYSRV